jgi:YHS domain-containing protein
MKTRLFASIFFLAAATLLGAQPQTETKKKTPREALQVFSDQIGDWKCTGTPNGTAAEKQKGFWTEKMNWEWQFKDKDVWIKMAFQKGKYYTGGEVRYNPEKDDYTLVLTTVKNDKHTYIGTLEMREKTKVLTFDREVDKETQRFVFRLLHDNVFNYGYSVKAEGRPLFSSKWSVLATRDGQSFASGSGKPECIVSGGTGTTAVSYQGKTYYVCCSGCRDEFNATPAKYVKEWEEKQAKAKKK